MLQVKTLKKLNNLWYNIKVMEDTENTVQKTKIPSLHNMFAHSYLFYFCFLVFSVILDFVFPIKIFNLNIFPNTGLFLILISNIGIFWAQQTSRRLDKNNMSKNSFLKGPYRFIKHPTYTSLFLLMLGFAFVVNGTFTFIASIIFFIISKVSFIRKEEDILVKKYGEHYLNYKKDVFF